MSVLTSLKAAAAAKLVSVDSTVQNYVTELEAQVSANKLLLVGAGVLGVVIGAVAGHLLLK